MTSAQQLPLFEGIQPVQAELKLKGGDLNMPEWAEPHHHNTDYFHVIRTRIVDVQHPEDGEGFVTRKEVAKIVENYEMSATEGAAIMRRLQDEQIRRSDEIYQRTRVYAEDDDRLQPEEVEEIQARLAEDGVNITVGLNDDGVLVNMQTGEPAIEALRYVPPRLSDLDAAAPADAGPGAVTKRDPAPGPDHELQEAITAALREAGITYLVGEQDGKFLLLDPKGQRELEIVDETKIVEKATGEILGRLDV